MYPSKKAKKVRSPACASLYHVTASSRADQCDSVTAHVTISCEGEANGILRDARPSVVGPYARPRRTREDAARAPARTFSLFLFNALESQDANGRTVRDSEDGRGRKGCARSTRTYGAHGYGGGEEAETRCSACNRGRLGFGTSELGRDLRTMCVYVPFAMAGCRPGNGDQLSSTQAEPGQAITSAVACFPSISCATSCHSERYIAPSVQINCMYVRWAQKLGRIV